MTIHAVSHHSFPRKRRRRMGMIRHIQHSWVLALILFISFLVQTAAALTPPTTNSKSIRTPTSWDRRRLTQTHRLSHQRPLLMQSSTSKSKSISNQQKDPNNAATFPLFQSDMTTTSTTTNMPNHQEQRRPLLFQKTFPKIVCSGMGILMAALALPQVANASNTISFSHPLRQVLRQIQRVPWKAVVKSVVALWTLKAILATYQVRKRQAKMATSEWSRYARHPAARGRAIVWIMIQQAIFVLASKVVLPKRSAIRQYAGRQFADSLLKLGPLYIKLGQIISCRKNLLGPEWIAAMANLQDKVPANTGSEAMELAYSALEGGQTQLEERFQEFDATPLAAASLGQVHKAKLRSNGDIVAVKIQRPNLRKIYDQDMEFLTTIAQWMDKMPSSSKNVGGISSSWTKIFQDAEEILYREIDYRDEAENGVRLAEDFGLTRGGLPLEPKARSRNNQTLPSAADWIRVPYVYQNISNERMLVMEFVPSIKVTDQNKLKANNVSVADQMELADSLARAYLRQFCCNLFFSTDPHPGNVGVEIMPNGKPRLVLYDFGQASSLTQGQADGILQIIEAIVDMDVDRSIEAFQKMNVLVDGADLDQIREKVAENYRTGKVKANRKRLRRKGYKFQDETDEFQEEKKQGNQADVSSDDTTADDTVDVAMTATEAPPAADESKKAAKTKDAQVMSYFSLPAEYAFVARAISQMDGVGKSLDPDFDFISNSAPYIVEIKGADRYLKEEAMKFLQQFSSRIAKWQMETLPEMYEKQKKGHAFVETPDKSKTF